MNAADPQNPAMSSTTGATSRPGASAGPRQGCSFHAVTSTWGEEGRGERVCKGGNGRALDGGKAALTAFLPCPAQAPPPTPPTTPPPAHRQSLPQVVPSQPPRRPRSARHVPRIGRNGSLDRQLGFKQGGRPVKTGRNSGQAQGCKDGQGRGGGGWGQRVRGRASGTRVLPALEVALLPPHHAPLSLLHPFHPSATHRARAAASAAAPAAARRLASAAAPRAHRAAASWAFRLGTSARTPRSRVGKELGGRKGRRVAWPAPFGPAPSSSPPPNKWLRTLPARPHCRRQLRPGRRLARRPEGGRDGGGGHGAASAADDAPPAPAHPTPTFHCLSALLKSLTASRTLRCHSRRQARCAVASMRRQQCGAGLRKLHTTPRRLTRPARRFRTQASPGPPDAAGRQRLSAPTARL